MLEHDSKVSSWINLFSPAMILCSYKYFVLRKYITYIKLVDSFPWRQGYVGIAVIKNESLETINKLLLLIIAYYLFLKVGALTQD